MTVRKRILLLIKECCFFSLFFMAYPLCEMATWGFSIPRLQIDPKCSLENIGTIPPVLLNQSSRFYLQKQGGQSYVFFSEDGQFVLKFFKEAPRPWLLSNRYREKKWNKLRRTFQGYRLAYLRLPRETGLLYLQGERSFCPFKVILVDRLQIAHTLDLSSCYFLLQKRANSIIHLTYKELVPQVHKLLLRRGASHLADHDPHLYDNLGLIEGELVFIDPGRFVEEENPSTEIPPRFFRHFLVE